MFEVNYVFDNSKCLVRVVLGEELDYDDLIAIRTEVRRLCEACPRYIAIYDYIKKPKFQNFSLTSYRKMTAQLLDIIISVGQNPVERSFSKVIHRIKPVSNELYFADTYEEAIALAKKLLPDQFPNGNSAIC